MKKIKNLLIGLLTVFSLSCFGTTDTTITLNPISDSIFASGNYLNLKTVA